MIALTGRFDKALIYASALHRHLYPQSASTRAIACSLAVAALVLDVGGDEDEAIAGLLLNLVTAHGDVALSEEIRCLFGAEVFGMIKNCQSSDYRKRYMVQADVRNGSAKLAAQLARSLLVALADSTINALAAYFEATEGKQAEVVPSLESHKALFDHYDFLARSFTLLAPGTLSERFAHLVAELNALNSPYAGVGKI